MCAFPPMMTALQRPSEMCASRQTERPSSSPVKVKARQPEVIN
uniref:Alternative protein FMN1 n=1 Tax=Homo sapiens TaxID=9606 RepID=L8EC76_HUMAN|nr:alternative protein FMN1 [Homo sapiens]